MAFHKEEFTQYLFDSGNKSPGGYCNSLDNIEKLLKVDVDGEYDKDRCESLYNKLQELRKTPELIGKNEHDVRTYASRLKKYVDFRNEAGRLDVERKNSQGDTVIEKIKLVISKYKENFAQVDKDEKYKWQAIGCYQKNWNIDETNFAEMLEKSFSKVYNLLSSNMYYPYKVLVEYAREHPEDVRSLFRSLYDESIPIAQRYIIFKEGFDKRIDELKKRDENKSKTLQHYQDLRAVMLYLTFRYPEKYYLYKSTMYTTFRDRVGFIEDKTMQKSVMWKVDNYFSLCELVRKIILEDNELVSMNQSRLDNTCYLDSEAHLLTMDVIYFGVNYMKDDDYKENYRALMNEPVYWPSLDEYDPGITKKQWKKYILEVEMTEHPSPMKMLKAMMELGGEATCKRLASIYGGTPSKYVGCAVNLGRRAKKYFNISAFIENDRERLYVIPFLGRVVTEDGTENYSYRIRSELYEALLEIDLSGIDVYFLEENDMNEPEINVPLNTILYGPPGTGKTYNTVIYAVAIIEKREIASVEAEAYEDVFERYTEYRDNGLIEFTTFHQSYGYEEFIEGIKPVVSNEETSENIKYDIFPGVFKRFCEKANQYRYALRRRQNYVFIIDEINRGNISKIFGELITLIEQPKRTGNAEGAKAILPYSQEAFGVPNNVYIIGTMNTADRSIAAIDTALRRRFFFKEMLPDAKILHDISVEDLSIGELLDRMNRKIAVLYDREHTIGHAYFTSLRMNPTVEKLADIFRNNIIPLLQEYFYEDYEKIRLVLGDNRKTDETEQFIIVKENDYMELFGDVDIGLDDGHTYEINNSAFEKIEAYRSI